MASRESTVWHLTPRGWESGDRKTDFNRTDKEPPPDRVLTEVYEEFMSSPFSPMDKEVGHVWSSDNKDLIDTLLTRFGPCPRHL